MIPHVLAKAAIEAEGFYRSIIRSTEPSAITALNKVVKETGVHEAPGVYYFGVPNPTIEVEQINARKQNIKCK